MFYILGILTGLVISTLIAVLLKRNETTIQRTLNQTTSKLKPKGSIIEPESEDMQSWIKSLEDEVRS